MKISNIARLGGRMEGCDCDEILRRLTRIETNIKNIEHFVFLSDVTTYRATTTFLGATVSVINAGHTYNFWGSGALTSLVTLSNNTTYYLAYSGQPDPFIPPALPNRIPELVWYQGSSTIGTMWIETAAGAVIATIPLRFDETGIWFRTTTNIGDIPAGSTFKFTQALILVDTTQPTP